MHRHFYRQYVCLLIITSRWLDEWKCIFHSSYQLYTGILQCTAPPPLHFYFIHSTSFSRSSATPHTTSHNKLTELTREVAGIDLIYIATHKLLDNFILSRWCKNCWASRGECCTVWHWWRRCIWLLRMVIIHQKNLNSKVRLIFTCKNLSSKRWFIFLKDLFSWH